jgi:hypothetical protein
VPGNIESNLARLWVDVPWRKVGQIGGTIIKDSDKTTGRKKFIRLQARCEEDDDRMPLTFDLLRDVVAIVGAEQTNETTAEPRSILGTGFVIAPSVLVTCWHCVHAPLPQGQRLAAAYQAPDGRMKLSWLASVSQDTNGADLATAFLEWPFPISLRLANTEAQTSEDVWTAGHSLSDLQRLDSGEVWLNLAPQFVRTYISRQIKHRQGGLVNVLSYELATATHAGLSGSPVIRRDSTEVIGVIYGNIDFGRVVEFANKDEQTGESSTQVERIISHGLAIHTHALRSLTGTATGLVPLWQYCAKFAPKPTPPPTPHEQKVMEIVQALQGKGTRPICTACRKADLAVVDCLGAVPIQLYGASSATIPWSSMMCVPLKCPNCGHLSFHAIGELGLTC